MPEINGPIKKAKGGKRPGAGRKPAAATILKRLAIAKANDEAEKSLRFCVELRDNERAPLALRHVAAESVMDRVWGRPAQAHKHSGSDGGPLIVQVTNYGKDKAPTQL
jgi:hypothetical protein